MLNSAAITASAYNLAADAKMAVLCGAAQAAGILRSV